MTFLVILAIPNGHRYIRPVDPRESLQSALAGGYPACCKLGIGGMATVFLARDFEHERKVACTVLVRERSWSR